MTEPADSLLRRPAVHALLLLAVATLWGSGFSLARTAVTSGIPPLAYSFWQFLCAGALALGVQCARAGLPRGALRHWRFMLSVAVVQCAIPNIVLYIVLQHVVAGVAALIVATAPMMTYALALGLGRERLAMLRLAGLAIGLGGVALLLASRLGVAGMTAAPGELGWMLLAFGTPLFYAISNTVIDRYRPMEADALALIAGMFLSAAVIVLPIGFAAGQLYLPVPPWGRGDAAVLAHGAATATAFVCFFTLIRWAGVVFASQVSYLATLAAVTWGIVLLGERHGVELWLALVLVLGGVGLVSLGRRRG